MLERDLFTTGSQIKDILYHGTTKLAIHGIQAQGFDLAKSDEGAIHLFRERRLAISWARQKAELNGSLPVLAQVVVNVRSIWEADRDNMHKVLREAGDLTVVEFLRREGYDCAALEFPLRMKGNHVIVPDTVNVMLVGVEYEL